MTEQALINLRRKRLAKRLLKKEPLFAYETLKSDFPDYTPEQFQKDITRRKSRSKRKKKNPLVRYGRYAAMSRLLQEYQQTGDIGKALQAQKLRDRLHHPYRIESSFLGKIEVFYCPALWDIKIVEKIVAMADGTQSIEKFLEQVDELTKYLPAPGIYHAVNKKS